MPQQSSKPSELHFCSQALLEAAELPTAFTACSSSPVHERFATRLPKVIRIRTLCVDSVDVVSLAGFWQSALGWRRTYEATDEVVLEPPAGSEEEGVVPQLLFLGVPETKTVKNRLHLDLRPDDQDAEVARLEALGARRVSVGQGDDVSWVVLADPEGNEFCVLNPLADH